MKYRVEWAENKNKDWKIVTLSTGDNSPQITEVSVNRVNKKGETFPNFDGIIPGADIEGELWKSPAGKNYLFAPRPQAAPRTGNAGIKAAVEAKAKSIERSQDRKDNSIQLSATFRDATILTDVSVRSTGQDLSRDEIKQIWLEWRAWLMSQFGDASDITETKQPF